jgi:hypothetical protein
MCEKNCTNTNHICDSSISTHDWLKCRLALQLNNTDVAPYNKNKVNVHIIEHQAKKDQLVLVLGQGSAHCKNLQNE